MATTPSPDLRLKLEERLICPVCLGHYTNPKILPCHHSFCQHCLERLPLDKKNETYYLSCPTCRHRTEVPEEGIEVFSVAFHLNDLKEMFSLTKKTAEATCSDHEKPLELFCETCDTVICVACQVRNHKNHEYDLIADSYTKHCQKLREYLSPVERKKEALKKVLSALAEREGEIRERGGNTALQQCRVKKISDISKAASFSLSIEAPDSSLLIQKISPDGYRKASVGKKGDGPLQFHTPFGIAISPVTEQVYIADPGNRRIQVLNPDLTFSHSFDGEGSDNGQFEYPCDIAIDSQGLVYVADYWNHLILKFSPDGKFVSQFGTEGSGPGQLFSPYVFTSDGVFVSSFGSEGSNIGQFINPFGLAFDKNGFFYVCNFVLRTDDQLMSEDEVKEIKTGLSAMKTGAVLDIFSKEDITGKEKAWLLLMLPVG
ncbi:PREDICTED: tripartite motif-containing protein 3-like [Amphimedon queenslandica]|uniref:RING-type domain-containing protein n=1 Tax=Amphimedon queenslandica TaxID=400682 RepID=A0AAN0J9W1_AMPQE|nr:PREDICTED: tripartite motif-containing protein 3-like [Amphimedon queenslandica]|eukprot:XP_019853516.1 PREDICTED: tripartite motif-containing protein 3-like [Amphimedon queenslandica]